MKTTENHVNLNINKKSLDAANESFRKLMLEIRPFIKQSQILLDTTEGKWQVTRFDQNQQFNKQSLGF